MNAATFGSDVAPGGIISIFGSGFGSSSTVTVNGEPAKIFGSMAFQINAQIPADIAPGTATVNISSPNGTTSAQITVRAVAPEIFLISPAQAAITNQDNSLNTPTNPAFRGAAIVIYATGFGAVKPQNGLNVATTPMTVVVGGTELVTAFAGLTPGAIGLYQANVILPQNLPPGLTLPLFLKQGGATSNIAMVAVQ